MADPKRVRADHKFERGEAAHTVVSLSQALLAPLDALLKAQVHAARSFLNFVLQMGYPHKPVGPDGRPLTGDSPGASGDGDGPYRVNFVHQVPGVGKQTISVPALALVPIVPLGVSEANFRFDFSVQEIAKHRQIQSHEKPKTDEEAAASGQPGTEVDRNTRPWFLVDTPLSLQGTFATENGAAAPAEQSVGEARFHIDVKVAAIPPPAALDKLLTGLTQVTSVEEKPPAGRPTA